MFHWLSSFGLSWNFGVIVIVVGRPTRETECGCVGSDTYPQVAGAAAEPPLPLTVGCVRPTIVTVTIVTHDNGVLDSLAMLVVVSTGVLVQWS